MHCVAVKKDGVRCSNKAKIGNLCGIHINSKKTQTKKQAKASGTASNIERFDDHIQQVKKEILKSVKKALDKPSRRRSA
jgi:hypothetical protein